TMYLVARTKENTSYFHRLHALDITNGAEKFGGPVIINANVAGVSFDPRIHNQRPGLVLDHGTVYIAWAGHDDAGPYHGWVMAYQAATLQQTGAFNVTPGGTQGGIWQSGQPPAVDSTGDLYLMTGNGAFTVPGGGQDVSQSFVKLRTADLALLDWFAQCDVDVWNSANEDLNSSGVLFLPNTTRIIGGGKQGRFFLLDSQNLGKVQQYRQNDCTNPQIPQSFQATTAGHIHGSPVYYVSPTRGALIYVWAEADVMKAYAFNGSAFATTPAMQSTVTAAPGMPGGFLSVSANGTQAGTGIVWATMPFNQDAVGNIVQGVLRAFDASNLGVELWNSRLNPIRDDIGNFAKFVPLTIANGKVYAATFSNQLVVYGLNPPPPSNGIRFVLVAAATPQQAMSSVSVTYPNAQNPGDLNIVVVGWNDTNSTVQSVTDSAGNAYSLAVGPTKGSGITQAIYYARNIVGGNNAVTVRFNTSAAYADIRILEYYGLDAANPFDGAAASAGNSAVSSSGPLTFNFSSELLFAANTVSTLTSQAGSPFVARIITSPDGDMAQDAIIVNAPGTYNATASLISSGAWVMQQVAFRGAGATQSTAPFVSAVSPTSGSTGGGTAVSISGGRFASGAGVSFGGAAASNVSVASASSITATTPAHAAGAVTVVVTNPD
ncbi:MAG TPA: IPT/TIG domain-containing protein, partial [Burkholderiaceae bacterium]